MPAIFEVDASDHACPYNEFKPCLGVGCMAWQWLGPAEDKCETDNLAETPEGARPQGVPPAPAGEGWEMDGPAFHKSYHQSAKLKLPPATAQRWVKQRPRAEGQCARHPGDDDRSDRYGSRW